MHAVVCSYIGTCLYHCWWFVLTRGEEVEEDGVRLRIRMWTGG
jgi:hypothetical protein